MAKQTASTAVMAMLVFMCMSFIAERGPGPRDRTKETQNSDNEQIGMAFAKHEIHEAVKHENAAADAEVWLLSF